MNTGFSQPVFGNRSFFREKSVLSYLVLLNIAVWAIIQALRVVLFLYNRQTGGEELHRIINLLAVPAYLPTLAHQPWSLFTYMVLHENIWHILFNMLWLYWFGKIFLQYLSQRQLLITYLLGGLAGALVYILSYNIFPVFAEALPVSCALGASASVMAIVTAISFYVPNYSISLLFLGRIKIVYLAIALFVLDFFMIPSGNAGGHLAHIGGALFGFAWAMLITPSVSRKMHSRYQQFTDELKNIFLKKKNNRKQTGGSSSYGGRPMTDEAYNDQRAKSQKRIDDILEKISRGGYESLTREEKDFLFRSSKKNG
ncbi:MAG TPA: rhomboid family intramembrane serine protease [Bacteroidales bacterium]|nr:rhomboid family intramembrane serine protease [Bacteroidales bacterium]HPS73325.1 rhomboid family intramembrane serine protease [Bacteroidales bacterium]